MPFQVANLVGQGSYVGEFGGCGFLQPTSIVLGESANEGWEAKFMVFTIKP
jgi:hypothetical protein